MIRLLWIFAFAAPAAGAFELAMPLDCTLGDTCFIQQYMDRDASPAWRDFLCGPLSYNDHEGTDFALPSLAAMQAGVTVRAASPGVVRSARDGMADIASNAAGAPALDGRDCGNGVLIDHEGGWQTQYCHMKQGSLLVGPGEKVTTGAPLGQVGLSGRSEFPHLHLTVRQDGQEIDPFDPGQSQVCGETPAQTLWATPLPYQPGGLISIGFSTDIPTYDAIKAGLPSPLSLPPDTPALVLWAYAFGSRAGDQMLLEIIGPAGKVLRELVPLDRTQAQVFRAAGKRSATGWPPGAYSGTAALVRDGVAVDRQSVALTVR